MFYYRAFPRANWCRIARQPKEPLFQLLRWRSEHSSGVPRITSPINISSGSKECFDDLRQTSGINRARWRRCARLTSLHHASTPWRYRWPPKHNCAALREAPVSPLPPCGRRPLRPRPTRFLACAGLLRRAAMCDVRKALGRHCAMTCNQLPCASPILRPMQDGDPTGHCVSVACSG